FHQTLIDRCWCGDAAQPDDPGRVRGVRGVWVPRPVHRTDTDRHRVHAAQYLARRPRRDTRSDRRVTRRAASPAVVQPGVEGAAGIRRGGIGECTLREVPMSRFAAILLAVTGTVVLQVMAQAVVLTSVRFIGHRTRGASELRRTFWISL